MTDWEQHLEKLKRRQKIAKKAFWCVILCLLVAMIAQSIAGLMLEPDEDAVTFTDDFWFYNNHAVSSGDDCSIQITTRGTAADCIIFTTGYESEDCNMDSEPDTTADASYYGGTLGVMHEPPNDAGDFVIRTGLWADAMAAKAKAAFIAQGSKDCNE